MKIDIEVGKSKRLLTAGKFCREDIVVEALHQDSVTPSEINFYDYDGTLLHACTVADLAESYTMPPLPEHDGLICEGWNWTLNDLLAHGRRMDVMPYYRTDNYSTQLIVENPTDEEQPVYIRFNQTSANAVTFHFSDNNGSYSTANVGDRYFGHRFLPGTCVVTITGNCTLGGAETRPVLGDADGVNLTFAKMLKHVRLGTNVTFGNYAFANCWGLETVTVPRNLPNFAQYVFQNARALRALTFPENGSTGIAYYLLTNFQSLEVLSVPKYIKSMSTCFGMRSLRRLCLHDGITTIGAIYDANALQVVELPNSITTIPNSAFLRCERLTRLVIPASVTSIGTQAFANCVSLLDLEFLSTMPPTVANENAFTGIPTDCVVTVPATQLETYQTSANYSKIAAQMVACVELPTKATWLTQRSTISYEEVTSVTIVKTFTGAYNETWNADAANTGTITAYRTGTDVTLCTNGRSKVRMNAESGAFFGGWISLERVSGLELLDAYYVRSINGAFNLSKVKSVDISMWRMPYLSSANGAFNECSQLTEVKLPKYGLGNLKSTISMFAENPVLSYVNCGHGMSVLSDTAFWKCPVLGSVVGLGGVTQIGYRAFCYTPNLVYTDLNPEIITTIGDEAFRESAVEDSVDLSAVPSVGQYATRASRWTAAGMAELQEVEIINNIYLDVPNSENQDNYPNLPFGTDADGNTYFVAGSGCSSLGLYHIWQALYAGTDKEFSSFGEWFEHYLNVNGDFAELNTMGGNTVALQLSYLGWEGGTYEKVTGKTQLQYIINQLDAGKPVYASIQTINLTEATFHAVIIIGVDATTRKLAVIDSHILGTTGVVSYIAFEDLVIQNKDRICLINYGDKE